VPHDAGSHYLGAAITDEDFDDGERYVSDIIMLQGQEVDNPYDWIETAIPNVFGSRARPGHWLVHTADEQFYLLRWIPAQNIWFCAEHGFGLCLEDDGEVKVLHGLNPRDLCGPQVYGIKNEYELGPYYFRALEECGKAYKAHNRFVRYIQHSRDEQDAFGHYLAVKAAMREHTNDDMLRKANFGADKARWEKKPEEQPFRTAKYKLEEENLKRVIRNEHQLMKHTANIIKRNARKAKKARCKEGVSEEQPHRLRYEKEKAALKKLEDARLEQEAKAKKLAQEKLAHEKKDRAEALRQKLAEQKRRAEEERRQAADLQWRISTARSAAPARPVAPARPAAAGRLAHQAPLPRPPQAPLALEYLPEGCFPGDSTEMAEFIAFVNACAAEKKPLWKK
jgi:hypothetical protein